MRLQINAAGKRWLDLIKSRWSTHIKTQLIFNMSDVDIRGFHGDYDVIIRYLGKSIQMSSFSIDKSDDGKIINMTVHGNGRKIVFFKHVYIACQIGNFVDGNINIHIWASSARREP